MGLNILYLGVGMIQPKVLFAMRSPVRAVKIRKKEWNPGNL